MARQGGSGTERIPGASTTILTIPFSPFEDLQTQNKEDKEGQRTPCLTWIIYVLI